MELSGMFMVPLSCFMVSSSSYNDAIIVHKFTLVVSHVLRHHLSNVNKSQKSDISSAYEHQQLCLY